MSAERVPDRLSSAEVALVLRRAAELDQRPEASETTEGFDLAAVEEAAREVGLSAAAVRQALAELRVGTLDASRVPARAWPGPQAILETRVVTGAPDDVHATVAKFLRKQTFQVRRHHGQRAVYRPRRDLVAKLRRSVDVVGGLRLHGVNAVIVDVSPVEVTSEPGSPTTDVEVQPSSVVRIEADLGARRRRLVTGATTSGVAAGGATGAVGVIVGEVALLVAAPPVGIAVGGATLGLGARRFRRRRAELSESLAGFLDRLD